MSSDSLLERLKRALLPSGGITERAVTSGIWAALINVSDRVLRLAKLVVLANLLAPEDFGLFGIAMLAIVTLRQFSQLGINTALIQKEDADVDRYLDTAWTVKLVRGIGIAAIAFVAAPFVAAFFSEPRAADVIRVVALVPLLTGIENPAVVYFRKNLEFHREFGYRITGAVFDVVVAVVAAYVLQSVWALVFGRLVGKAASTLMSYLIHGYRPRFDIERDVATELFDYGKWIFGSEIFIFLILQGDDAFVGWFLGAAALGFYQIAYRLSNAPATEITHVISSVVFPAYAQLQDEAKKLRTGFFQTIKITMVLALPVSVGIIVVTPVFVRAFLGEQWLPIIRTMQILAFGGAVRALGATIGPLFNALGRPDVMTKLQAFRLAIIGFAIYPATAMFGIAGAAAVIVGSAMLENPIGEYLAINVVGGSYREFVGIVAYPALASIIMGVIVYLVRINARLASPKAEFILLVFTGMITYLVVIALIDRWFNYELKDCVRMLSASMG